MRISVIIPVYNAAKFVEKAVDSALQFTEVKEVILIEDGSPDDALQICKEIIKKDKRIILLQHLDKKNHGAGASRNLGLKNATQNYIAFLDADDYYLPNRFNQDKINFNNPTIEISHNAIGFDYITKTYWKLHNKYNGELIRANVPDCELFEHFILFSKPYGHFHLDGLTIKRECLNKINGLFIEELRLHQDTEFIIRLVYYCIAMVGNNDTPVAMAGIHDENRITRIRNNPAKYKKGQLKLWRSVYNWAKEVDNINSKYLRHLYLLQKSWNFIAKSPIISWLLMPFFFIDFRVLGKPIYFDKMHRHLFGNNKLSDFLLKVKYKITKELGC